MDLMAVETTARAYFLCQRGKKIKKNEKKTNACTFTFYRTMAVQKAKEQVAMRHLSPSKNQKYHEQKESLQYLRKIHSQLTNWTWS